MTSSSNQEVVSVIIPCYNHAHFLGEAIASVTSQSYAHIELIVVDDGSTDDLDQIVKAYPSICFLRQDNLGISRARNAGLTHSKGVYTVFLDADDLLLPDAIDIGIHALAAREDCPLTFGLFENIGAVHGMSVLPHDQMYDYKYLLQRNFIGNPGAALYRRWVFAEIGGFDETNSPAADYDMYLRIARQFPILCHHQPVVKYRRHVANMSNNSRLMLASTVTVLKKQLRYVEGNQDLLAAYDGGLQNWRRYYGEPIIANIFEQFLKGHLIETALDVCSLVRFYPNRLLKFIGQKIAYRKGVALLLTFWSSSL